MVRPRSLHDNKLKQEANHNKYRILKSQIGYNLD